MGHDIRARLNRGDEAYPIASLRRQCWEPERAVIYEALDAMRYYADVSGDSEGPVYFSRVQLSAALAALPDGGHYDRERAFLRDCLRRGGDGVQIEFG